MRRLSYRALLAAAAMVLLTSIAGPLHAADVLDQQLDQPATVPPSAPPAQPQPAGPAPIDPSAAKAVDDAELTKELTDPAAEKAAAQNASQHLRGMVDRMAQSQSRLSEKDVGNVTQETQRRIVDDLDVVLEYARQQQQKPKPKPKPSEQKPEERKPTKGPKQGSPQQSGSTAAKDSQLMNGAVDAPQSNGTDLREKGPAEWGNLPPKDRDLISNGVNEQYLPAYKDMIDRYYQALAEIGKSKDKP